MDLMSYYGDMEKRSVSSNNINTASLGLAAVESPVNDNVNVIVPESQMEKQNSGSLQLSSLKEKNNPNDSISIGLRSKNVNFWFCHVYFNARFRARNFGQ